MRIMDSEGGVLMHLHACQRRAHFARGESCEDVLNSPNALLKRGTFPRISPGHFSPSAQVHVTAVFC